MRHLQGWHYLAVILGGFWIVFAAILIIGQFPFLIISTALTTLLVLSLLVIALAWAYQNNL